MTLHRRLSLIGSLLSVLVSCDQAKPENKAGSSIQFEVWDTLDVTNYNSHKLNGIYSICWTDIDNNWYPDLYVNNHADSASLFMNFSSKFEKNDVIKEIPLLIPDTHGAMWADFDNDGDPDLIQSTGAKYGTIEGPNIFLINLEGRFYDSAKQYGIDYPMARGRLISSIDFNGDGYLDVLFSADETTKREGKSALFIRQDNSYRKNLELPTTYSFYATDFLDQPGPEFISPIKIFGYDSLRPLRGIPYHVDLAVQDFNGDLKQDLFLVNNKQTSEIVAIKDIALLMNLMPLQNFVVTFKSNSDLQIHLEYNGNHFQDVHIYNGSKEIPISKNSNEFVVKKEDGTSDIVIEQGFGFSFNQQTHEWKLQVKGHKRIGNLQFAITSKEAISNLNTDMIQVKESKEYLLLNNGSSLKNESSQFNTSHATSVLVGDFDNDMDQDLIVIRSTYLKNQKNVLYENEGSGKFKARTFDYPVPDENYTERNAAVADFDLDGSLDFVIGSITYDTKSSTKSYQLFRNKNVTNHSIQVDLEGVRSNRDGIGAKVIVSAGGVKQIREQREGMHDKSQDFKRIHFGLGANEKIEEITILWPSGIKQVIKNVDANHIIKINELEGIVATKAYSPSK